MPLNFIIVTMLNMLFIFDAHACLTIIAGKHATANHKVIIARNSDSKDARRAKNLKIYTLIDGAKIYIGLPYWDLAFDPAYDMAQVATNQFGVSISATQTIQSNRIALTLDPPSGTGKGVSEPNIPSIVMPTSDSAANAIRLLGKAIESRGVNDGWGFGVLIADSKEAWYLETLSGHQWVAIRIPDNVYFVAANGPGQIQEYLPQKYTYLMSNYRDQNPIEFAVNHGIAHYINTTFNFRETFADLQRANNRSSNYVRIAYVQHQLNPSTHAFNAAIINEGTYPMFLQPEHPITLDEVKSIQSSHYEDYPEFDPYIWSYQEDSDHPFYYPIANPRTSNAHLTEIGEPFENGDVSISNVQYIALGMPGLSFYLPIYYGITRIPTRLAGGTNKADEHSLFWQFRKIQTLVFLHDPVKNIPYEFKEREAYVTQQYQKLQQRIFEKQQLLEQTYAATHDTKLIDHFTQETVDEVTQVNEQIIAHFLFKLSIDSSYNISNSPERNTWFTLNMRKQDCFYRRYQCDPLEAYHLSARLDKYADGPTE
jgi:dipeptidase